MKIFRAFESLVGDLRHGLRQLRKSPGFAAAAVITLGLGIGANTLIFSVVYATLLRPLPFVHPEELVALAKVDSKGARKPLTPADFQQLNENQILAGAGTYKGSAVHLTGRDQPEYADGWVVSSDLFSVLGIVPEIGHSFTPEDYDLPQARRPVILSHGLWQRRFGGDPEVVGQSVSLNGETHEVIGVMPRTLWFFFGHHDLWLPMENRLMRGPVGVARLSPGKSLGEAKAWISSIRVPDAASDMHFTIAELDEWHHRYLGNSRTAFHLLFGAVAFLLLIACANVASLLLVRGVSRQREFAMRAALGASRWRIVGQLLSESFLIAAVGALLGLALPFWGLRYAIPLIPQKIQLLIPGGLETIRLDLRVLAFTLAACVLTSVLCGLAPALQVARTNLCRSLQTGSRDSKRLGIWRILVVSEIALAILLMTGAGLMIRTFWQLQRVNLGFNPRGVMWFWLSPPERKYSDAEHQLSLYSQTLQNVSALPGVWSTSIVNVAPHLWEQAQLDRYFITGRAPETSNELAMATTMGVTPRYFQTLHIPLRQGRAFDDHDISGAAPVAILSEAVARRYWPNESPVGLQIRPEDRRAATPSIIVVGVVGDVKLPGKDPLPAIYRPLGQRLDSDVFLLINAHPDPMRLAGAVRREIWSIEKDQPLSGPESLEQAVSDSVSQPRFLMLLLGSFATLALLLGVIGVYGVGSYGANQRTQEIGIRMALGASQGNVFSLIMAETLKLCWKGIAAGLIGVVVLTRFITNQLYGVSALDSVTLMSVSLVLAVAALMASYIPARRAMQVDPAVALRCE